MINNIEPTLRFNKYDGTNTWSRFKLCDIEEQGLIKLSRGNVISKEDMTGGYPVYSSSIQNNGLMGYAPNFMFDKEMITWSIDGGGHLFYRPKHKFSITNVSGALEVISEDIDAKYLSCALQREHSKLNFDYVTKAHPSVIRGLYQISLPLLEEQQQIGNFFKLLDQRITLQDEKVKKLKDYKKGLLQRVMNKEEGYRFRDENGEDYPEWEDVRLGEISDVRDGTHNSPKYVTEGYPLVTSKNLTEKGCLDFSNINYITEENYNSINKRSVVNRGDILFGMIGTIGNPVLIREVGFAIKNVALIKEKTELYNIFLLYLLQSEKVLRLILLETAGNTQKFIALGKIREMTVSIPCKAEQQKIANLFTIIDTKIEKEEEKLRLLQEEKKGYMQRMFI